MMARSVVGTMLGGLLLALAGCGADPIPEHESALRENSRIECAGLLAAAHSAADTQRVLGAGSLWGGVNRHCAYWIGRDLDARRVVADTALAGGGR